MRTSGYSTSKIEDTKDYAGFIVYSIGNFDAIKETGHSIQPGWILIKETS